MARILFFGSLRDIGGEAREEALGLDVQTVGDLLTALQDKDPLLAQALQQRGARVAVDQVFADNNTPISDASEIAFMSPMSGG